MTKEEVNQFCKWAIHDKYLSQFRSSWKSLFGRQYDFGTPSFCVFMSKDNSFKANFLSIERKSCSYECQMYKKLKNVVAYFTTRSANTMQKMSLEEAKEYVYELAKHGIRRYNEAKKTKLLAKKTKLLKKVAQL